MTDFRAERAKVDLLRFHELGIADKDGATRLGYLPFNAGAVVRGPALEQELAERILTERQVFALLEAVADQPLDHALIRLLYNGGLRVSELVTLRWRNLIDDGADDTSVRAA